MYAAPIIIAELRQSDGRTVSDFYIYSVCPVALEGNNHYAKADMKFSIRRLGGCFQDINTHYNLQHYYSTLFMRRMSVSHRASPPVLHIKRAQRLHTWRQNCSCGPDGAIR